MTNNLFCKIFGRVQGVGYRAWAKRNAEKLNLTGWVRNCKDSSVEVEICGEKKKRDQFLKECHKGCRLRSETSLPSQRWFTELKMYSHTKPFFFLVRMNTIDRAFNHLCDCLSCAA